MALQRLLKLEVELLYDHVLAVVGLLDVLELSRNFNEFLLLLMLTLALLGHLFCQAGDDLLVLLGLNLLPRCLLVFLSQLALQVGDGLGHLCNALRVLLNFRIDFFDLQVQGLLLFLNFLDSLPEVLTLTPLLVKFLLDFFLVILEVRLALLHRHDMLFLVAYDVSHFMDALLLLLHLLFKLLVAILQVLDRRVQLFNLLKILLH